MFRPGALLQGRRPAASAGYTLPELVATLVVIGILAAVVVPRFAAQASFDVFGYAESARQGLRFAQKSAVAKRRTVCVQSAGNSLSFTYSASFGGACDPALKLADPAGNADYLLSAPGGVTLSAASFSFDPLGRASAAQSLIVSGGGSSQTLRVEAETGYVH